MTHNHSAEDIEQTNTAEGNVGQSAPSGSEAGAHGASDAYADHGGHDTHVALDTHGGHEADDSEQSTLVPVTWRQLIFPALILLIVVILLLGPVSAAFAPRPAAAPPGGSSQPTAAPTTAPGGSEGQGTQAQQVDTATPKLVAANTQAPALPTSTTVAVVPTPSAVAINPDAIIAAAAATRTAIAGLGEQGQVARAPVQLQFAGAQFTVDAGSGILPDWKPSGDDTHATWIQGTYANHIIYLPYSDKNAALFTNVKQGDIVKLTMDSGQVFEFQVSRSQRAFNGPPTSGGEFTVTTAMNQDHAGVTIFLIGDPAPDRAVVQADFTGSIQ